MKESRSFTILQYKYSAQLKKCYQVSNTALSLPRPTDWLCSRQSVRHRDFKH